MPKEYSESERAYIIKKLKEAAIACLSQFGVKKTSVDELVKRVNIPKGTFYLFYRSKELLFYNVFLEQHDKIQASLLERLASFENGISAEQFSDLIFQLYREVYQSFLLNVITNGDLELIMRKLPEDVIAAHLEMDDFNIGNLFAFIPQAKNKNVELYSGAFRAIFLTMTHQKEIGEDSFDGALKLLIEGLTKMIYAEETPE